MRGECTQLLLQTSPMQEVKTPRNLPHDMPRLQVSAEHLGWFEVIVAGAVLRNLKPKEIVHLSSDDIAL